jgi:NADPH:quinone reductase-like Zn-dependent oxidoreductase
VGSADRDPTRQASRCVCGDTVSGSNAAWVRELGADVSIDYRTEEFATIVHDYDLALDSLGGDNLESSLGVLPRGGKAIGISGPPDPAFAQEIDASLMLRLATTALSRGIRRKARRLRELRVPLHAR